MDLTKIRAELAARHASAPQRAALAGNALTEIEHGLAELAKLGERFELSEPLVSATVQSKENEDEDDPTPTVSAGIGRMTGNRRT